MIINSIFFELFPPFPTQIQICTIKFCASHQVYVMWILVTAVECPSTVEYASVFLEVTTHFWKLRTDFGR